MNTNRLTHTRPQLETLACVNERCETFGQKGQNNLTVRKIYGKEGLRYLRCQCCGKEFSERKATALWNTKVSEDKAIAVAEHLAEGCWLKATARLVKVNASVVRRLNGKLGEHGAAFHDEHVQPLEIEALEGDERHGYAHDKGQPMWEAERIDPVSKFVVSHVQGKRDECLIRSRLQDGASRLANRQRLVLLTDGEASYASLFPAVFGQAYRPSRNGSRGRLPDVRYRIPRTLAHVQIVKHRQGSRVVQVDIRSAHGSQKRVQQMLDDLGYTIPNTSAIERRNGTARRMSAHQVRKSLAFSRRTDTKLALGWWGVTVYNWCRPHRSLRRPLALPQAKKSSNLKPLRWHWVSPTMFGRFVNSSSRPFSRQEVRDNLISLPYFAFEEKSESDQYVVWCIDNKWLQPQLGEIWEANGFDKEAINKVARCRDGNSLSRIVNIPKRFVFPANPLRYNERLTIQQGVFLCPSDVSVSFQTNLAFLNECKDVKEHIYKLILVDKDGSFRKKALRHLERMNMSRATLFPGLDGFAQSLWTQLPRLSELPSHSYNETPEEPVLFSISTDGQR